MEAHLDYHLNDHVTVVIRSVRERTEGSCVASIAAQGIQPDNIEIIKEAPFSRALRSSFEVGLLTGRNWTLCVDADVLLRPNSISTLLKLAQRRSESICCVQGLMLDKFTVAIRAGGIHLYRTTLLRDAIREIPAEGVDIRPETFVLHAMALRGYPWVTVPYVIGIHDFGQYYEDIFRKCYVHANKHLTRIPELLPNWKERAELDPDFAVAIEGLAFGLRERDTVYIDKQLTSVNKSFATLRVVEKGAITSDEFSPAAVENLLQRWAENNVPVRGFPVTSGDAIDYGPDTSLTGAELIRGFFRKKSREIGFLHTIPFIVGIGIEHLGLLIKRLSSGRKEIS